MDIDVFPVTVRWAIRDPETHRLTTMWANPSPEVVQAIQDRYPDARQVYGPMIPGDKVRGARFPASGDTFVRDERTEEERDDDELRLTSALAAITAEDTEIPPPGLLAAGDAEYFFRVADVALDTSGAVKNRVERQRDAWTYAYLILDDDMVRRHLRGEVLLGVNLGKVLTRLEVLNHMREERGLVGIRHFSEIERGPGPRRSTDRRIVEDIIDFSTTCALEDSTDTGAAWQLLARAFVLLGGDEAHLQGRDV